MRVGECTEDLDGLWADGVKHVISNSHVPVWTPYMCAPRVLSQCNTVRGGTTFLRMTAFPQLHSSEVPLGWGDDWAAPPFPQWPTKPLLPPVVPWRSCPCPCPPALLAPGLERQSPSLTISSMQREEREMFRTSWGRSKAATQQVMQNQGFCGSAQQITPE